MENNNYIKDIENKNEKEELFQQAIDETNKRNQLLEDELVNLKEDKKTNKEVIEELKNERKKLRTDNNQISQTLEVTEEQYENQLIEYKKLVNKREHTQEVLNKQQFELNEALKKLERYSYAMGKLENMSLTDRILNRIPSEVKELSAPKEDNQ